MKDGRTPAPDKAEAYSWLKAPRYDGKPHEVGPLARILVAYTNGDTRIKKLVDGVLLDLSLPVSALDSVMGRHAARALECKIVADQCGHWVQELKAGEPAFTDFEISRLGQRRRTDRSASRGIRPLAGNQEPQDIQLSMRGAFHLELFPQRRGRGTGACGNGSGRHSGGRSEKPDRGGPRRPIFRSLLGLRRPLIKETRMSDISRRDFIRYGGHSDRRHWV